MLLSIKHLLQYSLLSSDEEDLGQIRDYYFDDYYWIVRYVCVDGREWLPDRKILLSPVVLNRPDRRGKSITALVTKKRVEESPSYDADEPISRHMENEIVTYYNWPLYWQGMTARVPGIAGMPPGSPERNRAHAKQEKPKGDPHLRSAKQVIGYKVRAEDGPAGKIDDLIVEYGFWNINYIVITTGAAALKKKVLIPPRWIIRINGAQSEVYVDLSREAVRGGPEFDPAAPVNREYEERLYDYYGRPRI